MAAVSTIIRFKTMPFLKTQVPRPPFPPPRLPGYGDSCFRAQCFLSSGETRLATFSGYDRTISILNDVENACNIHAKIRGGVCGETTLTFLTGAMECSGQLYFTFES